MLIPEHCHSSWKDFLTPQRYAQLNTIESRIGCRFTPPAEQVLRFLKLDLSQLKVVILGQDPYKPAGVANGRSFQPAFLEDWGQKFSQVSLKNMVRLIHKTYFGIQRYQEIASYPQVVAEIRAGRFPIKPPRPWFDSLEQQGVLFLNTYLTCEIGRSNSHKAIWSGFSQELLRYLSTRNPGLHWFLWGGEAGSNQPYIQAGILHQSRHPMMCSEKYEDDFLKCTCFAETADLIRWLG